MCVCVYACVCLGPYRQLLLQRGLSDTYTGGLSSYALTIMVASVLQR
jgi:hypothetical protein